MESSATREYLSLIYTFFMTHTVGGVFTRDEDRAIYALGSNTPSGVPYTEEEINALARKGKQRGHLPGVGRVLPGRATDVLSPPPPQCTHNSADVKKLKKKNKYLTKQVNLMMKLFRSNNKFSQILNQYESSPEFDNASVSGRCGDDEMADDEDGGEDEEDEEDGDSKDCAKIVKKQSKPDNIEHEIERLHQKPEQSTLSAKVNSSQAKSQRNTSTRTYLAISLKFYLKEKV
nr:hypothetical protein [Tanacetum cinerariifolium]